MSGMVASTDYSLFCYSMSLEGYILPYSLAKMTRVDFTTPCCRAIVLDVIQSVVSLSSAKTTFPVIDIAIPLSTIGALPLSTLILSVILQSISNVHLQPISDVHLLYRPFEYDSISIQPSTGLVVSSFRFNPSDVDVPSMSAGQYRVLGYLRPR